MQASLGDSALDRLVSIVVMKVNELTLRWLNLKFQFCQGGSLEAVEGSDDGLRLAHQREIIVQSYLREDFQALHAWQRSRAKTPVQRVDTESEQERGKRISLPHSLR